MQSNTARAGLAAALIAAAVVLFVVLNKGNSSDSSGATTTKNGKPAPPPTIVVNKSGQPVGGIKELDYNQGDQVSFRVRSGVADEVHVHGYDLHKDVAAGGTVSFDFPASISGAFVIELEARSEQIASLKVEP